MHLVKQSEKHDGPHADWFFETSRSGGGVTFDMGCHAIEFFRWLLGKPGAGGKARPERICPDGHLYPRSQDQRRRRGCLGFDVRRRGSRPRRGKLDQARRNGRPRRGFRKRGTEAHADVLYGNALPRFPSREMAMATRSRRRGATTRRWSFPIYEEIWNYGFPQEMEHFVACVREGTEPTENGHDGRAVVEAIHALYASAARGQRIALPFASDAIRPIDHWRPAGFAGTPIT